MTVKRNILLALVLMLLPFGAEAQRLAVKTNVLSLGAATPELGFELVCGEKTSLGLSVRGTRNPYWRDLSCGEQTPTTLFALEPELRYWFNGRPLTRFFAGVNALAISYDYPFREELYKGNAAGAGLTAGYVFNLTRRLDLEICVGSGLLFYRGKRQPFEDPLPREDEMPYSRGYKLTPTKLGISFVYIIR